MMEQPVYLPAQPTPLIGRDQEIAAVTARLCDPDVRLLTLSGPGGVGKTRLALAVATDMAEAFDLGAIFTDLASIRDPALVATTIVQSVGVREIGHRPAHQALANNLQGRSILVIVDNFEHVLSAATKLAEMLGVCPSLKVLVTSRAALHLRWEHEISVAPLSVTAAIELFIERARTVGPAFALTRENQEAVAAVCARLDGLPLAIELAAARTRVLSPSAILARLERRLQLLTGGPRDLPVHQRTLRDTITWSYDLLTEDEQRLFRRLAVFVGGWALEAAEAVCAGDGEIDVVEGLAALVDHSLVQGAPSAGEDDRFSMLETVREFALEQLEASSQAEDAARAHAMYFVALVESAEMESAARAQWLTRFDAEIANLRAALAWTRRVPDGALLQLRLAAATNAFWGQRGYVMEGYAWITEALERTADDQSAVRAAGLLAAGHTAWGWGEPTTARTWLERSVALYGRLGDERGRATALFHLAVVSMTLDDGRAALAYLEEGNAIVRAIGTAWEMARGITWLGFCHFMLGELEAARAELMEGLNRFDELGDVDQAAFNLRLLGYIARACGDVVEAWRVITKSVTYNQRAGDRRGVATSATALAGILLDRGQEEQAALLAASASAALDRLGAYGVQPGDVRSYQAIIASIRATLGNERFEVAWTAGQALPLDELLDRVLASPPTGRAMPAAAPAPVTDLSQRELEVLWLLAAGKSNPEIADALVISRNTVYRHVNHIFTKLGVQNRTEAALYAQRHGLIDREGVL